MWWSIPVTTVRPRWRVSAGGCIRSQAAAGLGSLGQGLRARSHRGGCGPGGGWAAESRTRDTLRPPNQGRRLTTSSNVMTLLMVCPSIYGRVLLVTPQSSHTPRISRVTRNLFRPPDVYTASGGHRLSASQSWYDSLVVELDAVQSYPCPLYNTAAACFWPETPYTPQKA
jgi:hypothetical protein